MMPYWGFGFHQCRYGMQDVYEISGVIANCSTADIPLEIMWTDIDYMDYRRIFSLDPFRFSLPKMRQIVEHLHSDHQGPGSVHWSGECLVPTAVFLLTSFHPHIGFQVVRWPKVLFGKKGRDREAGHVLEELQFAGVTGGTNNPPQGSHESHMISD